MDSSRQLRLGALLSYATIVFSAIAGLLYTPWMVREIGKSDYGLYVLATSLLAYFVTDFGLGQTLARFLCKYRAEKDIYKAQEVAGTTVYLFLLLDLLILIVIIVLLFFIENIFVRLTAEEISRFKVVYCIVGLFSIVSFPFTPMNGVLLAYEKFILLRSCELINKVGTVILMVIALIAGFKLYALVAINALMGLVVLAIKGQFLLRNPVVRLGKIRNSSKLIRQLLAFSFWIMVIGVAQRLLMNVTPTVLGVLSGTEQIAIFSIGMMIEAYVWTFANGLNGLFLPKVSELALKSHPEDEISKMMIFVGRIQLLIIAPVMIGISLFGKQFITYWMGRDFMGSYYVVLLLVLPGVVTLTQEIGITYLFVAGKLKYRAVLLMFSSILGLIISIVLAPRFGALGSSLGIFAAVVLFHVIGMNIMYWRVLKLDIPRFFKECHLRMLIPVTITAAIGIIIHILLPSRNLIELSFKIIIFCGAYLAVAWMFAMNAGEKQLVRSIVKGTL